MEAETISLRDGAIYSWRYRDPGDDRNYGRYHCCSCIAIAKGGRLWDTYWSYGNDGRSFGEADLPKLELTYLGNLSDLEKVPEWNAEYYDDADIVNLNHSNSSRDNFYLRKGAKRSRVKMLESARRRLEKAQSDIRSATSRAEQAQAAIVRIEAGEVELFL